MPKKFNAVGVYIFAGGFTLGVKKHFNVLAHLEDGDYGVETFQHNQPGIPVHTDIATWPLKQLKREKIDFVYSNPPCAPWSAASVGRKIPWDEDPRLLCVHNSFKVLEELRPKIWCWESVARTFKKGKPLRDELTAKALKMGYSVTHLLHEGSHLGLPQRRNRFLMIVHRVELNIKEPNYKPITVREALKGVVPNEHPELKFLKKVVPYVKPGEEARKVFNKRFGKRAKTKTYSTGRTVVVGRPSFQIRRLSWDKVSFTLTGGPTMLHPIENRYLSVAENAALCGYPKTYEFLGSLSSRYAQVAQCVTPPIGLWLAKEIARALKADKRTKPVERVIDIRKLPMTVEVVQ